ncbi:MAG: hypothetical protein C0624_07030 [Desulfuromonas sp.]|nr:MAG: hypothetical protein C0624_07030 [Desulfuromonas sp.]
MTMRFRLICGLFACLAMLPAPLQAATPSVESGEPVAVVSEEVLNDPELAFHAGVQLYRSGQLEKANNLFLDFLYRFPDTEWLHQIQLYLARISLDQKDDKKALIFIQQIPEELRSGEANFIAGVAHIRLGEYLLGVAELSPLQEIPLFDADRILLFGALGEAKAELGHPLEALFYFRRALELGGAQDQLISRSHALIAEMPEGSLEECILVFDGTSMALDARLQLARIALDAGRNLQARRLISEVQQDRTPFTYRGEIPILLNRLTGGAWLQRNTIGVVLPLTGRYAPFGKLAKRGIEMALANQIENNPELKLVYRDSAASPERSTDAVIELANTERVMAILGPLSGDTSEAAAERAEMDAVPLLSLSQKNGLPQTGRYIFRNSLTNRLQARELARYAVNERGLTAFAVLYPQSHKGRELAQLFAEEVKKLGGLVVEEAEYNPEETDFRHQIIPFIGEDLNTRDEDDKDLSEADKKRRQLPPETTFEALFIPDFAENVAMLLPQLVYYGVENVQLLGSNGWYSPKLVNRAGERFVNNAVLVNGFFPYSDIPFVREFVERYYREFSQDPSFIEAQAYDAANILFGLLSDPRIATREELLTALTQLRNYPGVTGATSFDLQGEVDKTLFLLQVDHGNFVQIN